MEDIVERLRKDIDEWKRLGELCQRPKVKEGIEIEVRRAETALVRELEKRDLNSAKNDANAAEKKKSPTSATAPAARSYDVQIKNYSWDQSDKFVKVYLTGLKGVQDLPKEAVTQEFTKKSARVRVEGLNGQNPTFFVGELCKEIDPDKSYVKVKSDMVSVFLAKSESGSKWSGLRPSGPPKSVPKMDDNADPSAGLMSMMKQMYDEGDDEMKRTIAKAWTESRDKNPMGDMGGLGGL